jgi:hypothetical protein
MTNRGGTIENRSGFQEISVFSLRGGVSHLSAYKYERNNTI